MTNRLRIYVVVGILALLVALRFFALEKDPPLHYVGHSQALITDPYHLSFSARNAVLFGNWNPQDYHRWDIFKYSLSSGVSYLMFSMFGVSRFMANIGATVLQLGGFLFFLLALYRLMPPGEVIVTAGFLLLNSSLFFFGRLPFLENGLIFLSGLLFFLFIRYHDRKWGQVLTGLVLMLAVLSGKLFGLLLLGPVVISLVYLYRRKVTLPLLYIFSGMVIGGTAVVMFFYGGDVAVALNYYREQTVGMYGRPPGFLSVSFFFEMLITYGAESRMWAFTPFLLGFGLLSLIRLSLTFPKGKASPADYLPVFFCAIWFISALAGLSPFYYRPLRYALFIFVPLSALSANLVWTIFSRPVKLSLTAKWITIPLIFLISWYSFTQIAVLMAGPKNLYNNAVHFMPLAAVASILFTAVITFWLYKNSRALPRRILIWTVAILALGHVGVQASYLYKGMFKSARVLRSTNKELAMLLGPGSMLTGPYMPAFTIDNKLPGIIYMFGLVNVQKDLFTQFPITHVVTDPPNWKAALKDFPFLAKSTEIVQIARRDRTIDIYRVPGAKNILSDFERASMFIASKRIDSALVYLKRFHTANPTSLYGGMHLAIALIVSQQVNDGVALIDSLLERFPDSYQLHLFCKVQFSRLYQQTKDADYFRREQFHQKRMLELNSVMSLNP